MADVINGIVGEVAGVVGAVALIVGLVLCFFGIKISKLLYALVGFAAGMILGVVIGIGVIGNAGIGVILGVVLGVLVAVLLFKVYRIAAGVNLGLAAGLIVLLLSLFSDGDIETAAAIAVVGFVIFFIIGFIWAKWSIIISYAVQGGVLAGSGLSLLVSGIDGSPDGELMGVLAAVFSAVFITLGIIAQAKMEKKKNPPKSPKAVTPSGDLSSTTSSPSSSSNSATSDSQTPGGGISMSDDSFERLRALQGRPSLELEEGRSAVAVAVPELVIDPLENFDPNAPFVLSDGASQKLEELKKSLEDETITQEEFDKQKQSIIAPEQVAYDQLKKSYDQRQEQLRLEQQQRLEAQAARQAEQAARQAELEEKERLRAQRQQARKESLKKHRKAITLAVGGVVVVVGAYFGIMFFASAPPSTSKVTKDTLSYLTREKDYTGIEIVGVEQGIFERGEDTYFTVNFTTEDEEKQAEGVARSHYSFESPTYIYDYTEIRTLEYTPKKGISVEQLKTQAPTHLSFSGPNNLSLSPSEVLQNATYTVVEESLEGKTASVSVAGSYTYDNAISNYEFTFPCVFVENWSVLNSSFTLEFEGVEVIDSEKLAKELKAVSYPHDSGKINGRDLTFENISASYSDFYDSALVTADILLDNEEYSLDGKVEIDFLFDGANWKTGTAYADLSPYMPKKALDEETALTFFNFVILTANNKTFDGSDTEITDIKIAGMKDGFHIATAKSTIVLGLFEYTFMLESSYSYEPGVGYILEGTEVTDESVKLAGSEVSQTFDCYYHTDGNPADIRSSDSTTATLTLNDKGIATARVKLGKYSVDFTGKYNMATGEFGTMTADYVMPVFMKYRLLINTSADINCDVTMQISGSELNEGRLYATLYFDPIALGVSSFEVEVYS